jgi:hypothetical protein
MGDLAISVRENLQVQLHATLHIPSLYLSEYAFAAIPLPKLRSAKRDGKTRNF